MKKIIFSIVSLILLAFIGTQAQAQVAAYDIYEDFTGVTAPWDFTAGPNTTITIETGSGSHGDVLQFYVNNAGGRRISSKVVDYATATESDGLVRVEFDWQTGTPTANGADFIRLLDGTDVILAVGAEGTTADNVLHYGNLDAINSNTPAAASTLITPASGTFPRNEWYHIKAVLNFDTRKVVSFQVTKESDSDATYESLNKDFIGTPNVNNAAYGSLTPSAASSITKIEFEGGRNGSANGTVTAQIDNFHVSSQLSTAAITAYDINEDFTNVTDEWGFTAGPNTTISIVNESGSHGNVLQFYVNNAGGRRISPKTVDCSANTDGSDDGLLYVEFDWQTGTPTANGADFIRLLDGTHIILAVGAEGTTADNVLHYGNLSTADHATPAATSTLITPVAGTFPRNEWYHVKAVLNFDTHKVVSFQVTKESDPEATYEILNKDFINSVAASITKIEFEGGRNGSGNGTVTAQIDNFQVYHKESLVQTPYQVFTDYVALLQSTHDSETRTDAFIVASKATLQAAIDAAKAAITETSTEEEIAAATEVLEAALVQFEADITAYTSLKTAITTITNRVAEVTPRIGTRFLNYPQATVDVLTAALTTAETALSTAATATELTDAVTALNVALTAFNAAERVAPGTNSYKIYSYGVADGNGDDVKKIIYADGENVKYSATEDEVTNTEWIITQTEPNVYTVTNKVLGTCLVGATLAAEAQSMTLKENAGQAGEIFKEEGYFLYGILNAAGARALELTADGATKFSNGMANRFRFAFQFEEQSTPVTAVQLNRSNTENNPATIAVGASQSVKATITPTTATNAALVWTSSDETVATVTGGESATVTAGALSATATVTGVAPGTATITVTTVEGGLTASYIVRVPVPVVAVTGVSLDKTAETIKVGDNLQLTATVAPENATNQGVSWSSSDETVATVTIDGGLVTALKAGTTTITVTTASGNFTATCLITVSLGTDINNAGTAKDIQSVESYNLTGVKVSNQATGSVIKKITYTDGSVEVVKAFVKEK
ncbi:hypothetical protein FACS1894176_03150 [Bacteroidia bacterium]|nr:hypothetical protein FACS1894176_03150 [Bacteroidia bacterium]